MARPVSDACRDEVAGEARWAMAGNVCSHGHSRRHRAIYRELSPPDVVEQELPLDLTCDVETPETYVQAHTGPHSDIWTEAEGKELRGLNATGTFEVDGSE